MKLSIIIPVYNEKETILEILDQIQRVDLGKIEKQIVIIDDGSMDGTRETLRKLEARDSIVGNSKIKVIYHDRNQGKGTAIRTGLKYADGDLIIIQDADLEYDPEDYPRLIKPMLEGKAKVVYGSRILEKKNKKSYQRFYFGGKLLTYLTNLLYRAHITDEPTCYKVFRKEVLENIDLKCKKFEFCPEVTAKVIKQGYKIYEVPISYHPRNFEKGKKIGWKDGLQAIYTLIKYRFID